MHWVNVMPFFCSKATKHEQVRMEENYTEREKKKQTGYTESSE